MLSCLQNLPIDLLKIDGSFIKKLPQEGSLAIVKTIISLSHNLGFTLIAEAIETEEQARLLRMEGCDYAQGYFYARPMQGGAFEEWAAARTKAG